MVTGKGRDYGYRSYIYRGFGVVWGGVRRISSMQVSIVLEIQQIYSPLSQEYPFVAYIHPFSSMSVRLDSWLFFDHVDGT